MLEPAKVFAHLEATAYRLPTERVPLHEATGRILCNAVRSPIASPPFNKAAMDGYAVKAADDGPRFRLVETISAGTTPQRTLQHGECAAIMTGAMLPRGADKVVRREYTRREGDEVVVTAPEPLRNVIEAGENCVPGDSVLTPRLLRPQDIGVAASVGVGELEVARRPHAGVISTGTELCAPGQPLGSGQIYNSNGYQIAAQLEEYGCTTTNHGVVGDEPEELQQVVDIALRESNLVVLSGGVSMGELDYVPEVLIRSGVQVIFHRIAFKPGKPTLFGRKDDTFVFALAGNPVSTFVLCEVLIRPFLRRICGLSDPPVLIRAVLAEPVRRKRADRLEFLPARLEQGLVYPLAYQGSAHLNVLSEANCLFSLEVGTEHLAKGTAIDVRPI